MALGDTKIRSAKAADKVHHIPIATRSMKSLNLSGTPDEETRACCCPMTTNRHAWDQFEM